MLIKKCIQVAIWAVLISSSSATWAAGDKRAGQDKAYTCTGCHGAPNVDNVYPTYRAPKIAGQSAVYIQQALKAYATGSRKHPTMRAQARSLSEQDIADIAAYLESLGELGDY